MRKRDPKPRRSGEECSHPGCKGHRSHPCEGCGRFGAQGEYLPEWRNEYMCEFWDDHNQVYLRLRELVISYLNETEDYDQQVCSGRKGKMAMPVSSEEVSLISRHAYSCLQRYLETARKERLLDEMSWTRMRQRVEREWEAEYTPHVTQHVTPHVEKALDKREKVGRVKR